MPKLIDIPEVRDRMGYPNDPDINTAITNALDGATIKLEGLLRTRFSLVSVTDTFYVTSSVWNHKQHRSKLLFTRGFVSTLTLLDVKYAGNLQGFNAASSRTDLDLTLYGIQDPERGVLDIVDFNLSGLYVQATYDSGFPVDGADPTLYDQTKVPDWLKEAAELMAVSMLQANPVLVPENRPESEVADIKADLSRVITPHIRYVPSALKPITTEGGLYSLSAVAQPQLWQSGEALTRTSGTVWTSAKIPINAPIVQWGNLVWSQANPFTATPNEFNITSGNVWTFDMDLGTQAPVVWYQYQS